MMPTQFTVSGGGLRVAPDRWTRVLSGGDFAFLEAINTVNFKQVKLAVPTDLYSHHGFTA